jgi:hypothetical protein
MAFALSDQKAPDTNTARFFDMLGQLQEN